jgi:hypothetical protein
MSFYLSLSEDIKELIESILRKTGDFFSADSWRAILSQPDKK